MLLIAQLGMRFLTHDRIEAPTALPPTPEEEPTPAPGVLTYDPLADPPVEEPVEPAPVVVVATPAAEPLPDPEPRVSLPEGAVDYQVIVAYRYDAPDIQGPLIYVKPGHASPETGGWYSLWPFGRETLPDAWMFARRVCESPEAWIFVAPTVDIVPPQLPAFVMQIRDEAAAAWTFDELRADTSPLAMAVKAGFVDERPRLSENQGTEEEPVVVDIGPDPSAERIALYFGIGTATADRLK